MALENTDNRNNRKKIDFRFITVVVLCAISTAAFITSVVLLAVNLSGREKPPAPAIGSYEQLAQTYKYNAVEVKCGDLYGSAFVYTIVGKDMYLFTNYHVVRPSFDNVALRFYGRSAHNPAADVEVVGYDKEYDIALLRTRNYPENEYVDLKKNGLIAETANMGAEILCLGNNLGHGIQAQNGIVSNGSLVRSIKDDETGSDKIRAVVGVCAPLNSGDSGAAVFDLNGRLVGMNTWKVTQNSSGEKVDDTCYLTPAPIIAAAYENLVTRELNGEIPFPVTLWQSNTGGTVNNYGKLYIHDLKVVLAFVDMKLTVTGADALATLKEGDVIKQFGRLQVTANNFPSLIGELFNYSTDGSGEKLKLTVVRGGSKTEVVIDSMKSVR